MKIIKNICIVLIIAVFFTACKTAELNSMTERVAQLEKENAQLKKELEQQQKSATEAVAQSDKAMEEVQRYSMIAGQNAAESQRFQAETKRLQEMYDECINKKKN